MRLCSLQRRTRTLVILILIDFVSRYLHSVIGDKRRRNGAVIGQSIGFLEVMIKESHSYTERTKLLIQVKHL